MLIKEGEVTIKTGGKVFYNPRMELNRDLSIACIAAYSNKNPEMTFVDALAATGARGVRVAKEAGLKSTVNDWNSEAFELIKQNIEMSGVKALATASNTNAGILLSRERFDIVDLDPFGTPVPYLDAACRSVKKMLCVTATDTAPLCGAHLKAGIRNYDAYPLKTEYHNEVGVRILIGKIMRELAKYDKAAKPLLSYVEQHYYRVYLKIEEGAAKADTAVKKLGFFVHCFNCFYRAPVAGIVPRLPEKCPKCGKKLKAGGKLWLGEIGDRRFQARALKEVEKRALGKKAQAIKLLSQCREELPVFSYYDHHKLCKMVRISPGEIEELIAELRSKGYKASRTHFSGVGFKTDADVREILKIIKQAQ